MSTKAAAPPGCTINISDVQVQEAAIRIQASYRGHRCIYQTVEQSLLRTIGLKAWTTFLFFVEVS